MKRYISLCMCALLLLCLAGCESAQLQEAKECIDTIYEATSLLAEREAELARYANATTNAERAIKTNLENQVFLCERLIAVNMEKLEDLYGQLSAEERQILKEYAQETLGDYLENVWN